MEKQTAIEKAGSVTELAKLLGIKREAIYQWKDKIPSAEFHAIPETGHLLMEENPELFNDMVLAFLESHENNIPGI